MLVLVGEGKVESATDGVEIGSVVESRRVDLGNPLLGDGKEISSEVAVTIVEEDELHPVNRIIPRIIKIRYFTNSCKLRPRRTKMCLLATRHPFQIVRYPCTHARRYSGMASIIYANPRWCVRCVKTHRVIPMKAHLQYTFSVSARFPIHRITLCLKST